MKLFNLKNTILLSFVVFLGIYLHNTILMINHFQGNFEILFIYNFITTVLYFLVLIAVISNNYYSQIQLLLISFSFTLVLVLANNYLFQSLDHSYFALSAVDSLSYDKLGSIMMRLDFSEKLTYISSIYSIDDFGFPLYLSYVYSIIHSPLFENILNVCINLGTVLLLFKTGCFFLSQRYAFLGALIYGISQYAVFYMSSGLKETLMIFFIVGSIYFYLKYIKKNKIIFLIYCSVCVLALVLFRIPLAVFLVVSFACNELTKNKGSLKKYFMVGFLILCAFLIFQLFNNLLFRYILSSGNEVISHTTNTGSHNFAYVTALISGLFGPFPNYMPFDGKENLSLFAGSLTLKIYLALPFLYASFYAIKFKNIYMKPLVFFTLFEIAGLVFLADTFELRKSLPHLPFVIMLAMYVIAHRKIFIRGVHKHAFASYYMLMTGFLFMWNYLRL